MAKVDRFARNTEDHFAVRQILLNCGTQLHSVSEPIGDDPTSKLFETILAGFSDFDNAVRRQRAIDGLSARINQGLYPRKPPLGYLSNFANRKRLKKTEPDRIDPEIFPILQQALNEFSQGLYTRSQLCARLDELGLDLVRGRSTYKQLVDQLLAPNRLKFYAGIIENPWTGKDVPGLHRPLITHAAYQRILEHIRTKKAKPRWQETAADFPLRRTARCCACQAPFVASYSKGRGGQYAYYRCSKKGCPRSGKSVRRKLIEGAFVELLNDASIDERFRRLFEGTIQHHFARRAEETTAARQHANRTRAALQARRQRIYAMAEEGLYATTDVAHRVGDLDRRLMQLEESMAVRSIYSEAEKTMSQLLDFHMNLGDNWRSLPLNLQQRLQEFVFPNGLVFDHENGKYRTPQTPEIFRVLSPFSSVKTTVVRHTSNPDNGEVLRPEVAHSSTDKIMKNYRTGSSKLSKAQTTILTNETTVVRHTSHPDNGEALRPEDVSEDLKEMMEVWIDLIVEAIQHRNGTESQSPA